MKKQKITIEQEDGNISIYRNGEFEQSYDLARYVERIKEGEVDAIAVANFIAEIMNDALNCKSASSALHDLNEKKAYFGTYFESIDFMAEMEKGR